jgi:hypothetical protein
MKPLNFRKTNPYTALATAMLTYEKPSNRIDG